MNHSSASRLVLACFGLMFVAVSPAVQAGFKCDQPQLARIDATACALGARDVASLRRYVTRTQAIHDLQMSDYVRPEGVGPDALRTQPAQALPRSSVATSHLPRTGQ